ncbi:PAS domain-containing protein [Natronococcus sp. A-GB1]|uniref:PAS domain-containing protein n=1 Tax=Natronococcus sp. A-GB1 TaxID=3037648 RepID=UPI00241C81B6|nr:PAS domain-containing protein [Natronococcus sp. A-GB1]MDG5759225.1 PAS domain-containing protein [Natronococcus sp. A-GB1]
MDSTSDSDATLRRRIRQQEVIADLAQRALEGNDLDQLLHDASVSVAETLGIECVELFELRPDDTLALRESVGWPDESIDSRAIPVEAGSQADYTLRSEEPIVVDDFRSDERFSGPESLVDGAVSGTSVVVGSAEEPWGVLGAHATERRAFTRQDVDFIERVADVLATAIETKRTYRELEEIHGRISDGFFALDENWEFAYLNERAHELINPDHRELIGTNVWEAFPEASSREFKPLYERAMADEETIAFEEYYPEPLDSWFEVRAYPSETGLSVYFRDITDRKVEKQALEETRRRYRTLVEHFPNGAVALVDRELRYVSFGGAPEGTADVTRTEIEGEPVREVLPTELETIVAPRYEDALEGETSTFETSIGDEVYRFHFVPVRDDGGDVVAAMGLSQDITERAEAQRRLEESEQRYRALVEHFPNGVVTLFDHDLEYLLAAGQAFEELDLEPADLEGRRVREIWPESVAATLEPAFRDALDGTVRSVELEYAGRDWIVHAVPVTDDGGDVSAGMTMAQDITDRKERERYLRDAKAQLEAATEAGAVGTWEWQIQEDRFVTGASFARTFGVEPEAAREGVPLERLLSSIHAADRDRVERRIEEAVETCGEYEAEYRVWNADDDLRWVIARGHVESDEQGVPETFPGALTDITDRKQAELEAEKQRTQLETLFELLPVGVVVAEADGRLVEANDAAAELWGGDVFDAETVGDYERYDGWWLDTGEPIEPEEWPMSRVLEGETILDPDVVEIETVDGERRTVMIHGMPIRDEDGEIVRGVLTQTDVTERREYRRRLEESNERLEQFAYAASHDLQEPLRMVASYLQLIESRYAEALDDDGQEFLAYAVDGAERMRAMIEGLLQYSRVEARGEPLAPVDLEAVLEDVLADLQLRIEESDAEITIEPLPRVEGDGDQLRQVFQNLLENAITYSGDDPPRVRVDADRRGDEWTIAVRDDGIGIPPEEQERVFEVFHRLHSQGEHDGTGIGLALCERIVERHGGEITVDSEPGKGSTFSVTLSDARDR